MLCCQYEHTTMTPALLTSSARSICLHVNVLLTIKYLQTWVLHVWRLWRLNSVITVRGAPFRPSANMVCLCEVWFESLEESGPGCQINKSHSEDYRNMEGTVHTVEGLSCNGSVQITVTPKRISWVNFVSYMIRRQVSMYPHWSTCAAPLTRPLLSSVLNKYWRQHHK